VAQLINVVGSILAKVFLGPVNVGIWSALQLILDFSKYSGLGVNTVVNLDVPYYQAKGDLRRVSEILSTVFTFLCLSSLTIGIAVMIYAFWNCKSLSREFFWGLIFASGIILLQRINNFYVTLLRAFKSFGTASRQTVYSALVNVFLISIFASKFKIYGFLWATALSLFFNIVYIQIKEKYTLALSFKWGIFRKTVASGIPLMILGLGETFFRSVDKFMILKFLGFEAMGFYSIGLMAANYLNSLHVSIAVVLLPHFQEKFGVNDSRKDLRSYFNHGMHGFSNLFPPLIAFAWVLSPYATLTVLKSFGGGIPALKWIVLGIYFVSLGNLCSNYLITVKERGRVLFALIIASLTALGLGLLVIKSGLGPEGIAFVSMFSSWFYFSILFYLSMTEIYTLKEAWQLYGIIMLKFILLLSFLKGIDAFVLHDGSSLLRTCLSMLLVTIGSIPFIWDLNRKIHFIDSLRNKFLSKKLK
jgi:O-antigen/teichoic acid export membrane protein